MSYKILTDSAVFAHPALDADASAVIALAMQLAPEVAFLEVAFVSCPARVASAATFLASSERSAVEIAFRCKREKGKIVPLLWFSLGSQSHCSSVKFAEFVRFRLCR